MDVETRTPPAEAPDPPEELVAALKSPKVDADLRHRNWGKELLAKRIDTSDGGSVCPLQLLSNYENGAKSELLYLYDCLRGVWGVAHWGKRNSDLWNLIYDFVANDLAITSNPFDVEATQAAVLAELRRQALDGVAPMWIDPRDDAEQYHKFLTFENGILDLDRYVKSGEVDLRRRSARFLTTSILPFAFDPLARCPKWEAALRLWHPGDIDTIGFLQEYVGYIFEPNNKHELAVILDGEGENGKSTFLQVIEELVGSYNVSSVSLSEMGDKFLKTCMVGKLLNRADETNPKKELDVATIKQVISGNPQPFQHKFGQPFQARLNCKLLIAWNTPPRVNETAHGMWRKLRVVPWYQCLENLPNRRTDYFKELVDERPGIFNWAMGGLRRVRSRDGNGGHCFTNSSAIISYTNFLRKSANPNEAFIKECLRLDPTAETDIQAIMTAYREWCSTFMYDRNKALLWRQIRKWARGRIGRHRRAPDDTGERPYFYRGLKLIPPGGHTPESEISDFYAPD